jgi:putative ATP-dependent endonuclease of OLD family
VYFRALLPKIADASVPEQTQGAGSHEPIGLRRATRCIPLEKLDLTDLERRKIDRYLDVTRSAFLFGGRVLLVEGIAEALLLPVIAKNFILKGKAEQLRRFRSAVFVPIGGVDFAPYVKLLLSPYVNARIAERVIIVTDGDKTKAAPGEETPGNRRKSDLECIARELGAVDLLDVVVNTYSLETELVRSGNGDLLREVYLELHEKSANKWDAALAIIDSDKQAEEIQKLFESTRKGDFAQIIAEKLSSNVGFHVPDYLTSAIEALVK